MKTTVNALHSRLSCSKLPLTTITYWPSPPDGTGANVEAPGAMLSELPNKPCSSFNSGISCELTPEPRNGKAAAVVTCQGLRSFTCCNLGRAPGKRCAPGSNRVRNVMNVQPVFSSACSGP